MTRRTNMCPKCGAHLKAPAPHADGLPGILYRECAGCGHTKPVTAPRRWEKLPEMEPVFNSTERAQERAFD